MKKFFDIFCAFRIDIVVIEQRYKLLYFIFVISYFFINNICAIWTLRKNSIIRFQ